MIQLAVLILLGASAPLGQKPAGNGNGAVHNPIAVARSFLPPNSKLAQLYRINYHPRWSVATRPAVLATHIVSRQSEDLVFAYYSPQIHTFDKTLFVTLLHPASGGYEQAYTVSYRDQVLLVPDAMRILHLGGWSTSAVAVIAGMGAALGGHLDVFVWRDPWGWQNIFPRNGSMDYFYFFPKPAGLVVALTSANHPGLNVSPPPLWYRWNGKRFVKIPPPKGSSKWPLPD
ncbi:MAG: hypothetical protein ACRD11_14540 [Terriglobia bacterium]